MEALCMILLLSIAGGPESALRVHVKPLNEIKLVEVKAPVAAVIDSVGRVYVLDRHMAGPARRTGGTTARVHKFDASGHLLQTFDLGRADGISLALSGDQLFVGLLTPMGTEIAKLSTNGERLGRLDLNEFVPLKIFPRGDGTLQLVGFDRKSAASPEQYLVRTVTMHGSVLEKAFAIPSVEAAKMTGRAACFAQVEGKSLLHIQPDGTIRDTSGNHYRLRFQFPSPPPFVPTEATRSISPYLAVYDAGRLFVSLGESISYRDATGKVQRLVRDYVFVFDKEGKLLATSGPITASPTMKGEDGYYYILGYDENGQVKLVRFRVEIPDGQQ